MVPSGKQPHNYGKSPFFMGKVTISMAIFNSFWYVYRRVRFSWSATRWNKLSSSWIDYDTEMAPNRWAAEPIRPWCHWWVVPSWYKIWLWLLHSYWKWLENGDLMGFSWWFNGIPSGYDCYSSPWLSHGPNRNRWFTEVNSMVDLSMANWHK